MRDRLAWPAFDAHAVMTTVVVFVLSPAAASISWFAVERSLALWSRRLV